jgi:hypothetical protein
MIRARYDWEPVAEEFYPDFKIYVWLNHPHGLYRDVYSGDTDTALAALVQLMPEHNGWRDFEGKPYPPANTPEFWLEIPNELYNVLLIALDAARHRLPNSLQQMRQTFRSISAPPRGPSRAQTPPLA